MTENSRIRTTLTLGLGFALLAVTALGCAPTVNLMGVYFPPSLVSAIAGLVVAYVLVRILAVRPSLRPLAQSGLFFLSLTLIAGFLTWWGLFSGF